MFISLTFNSLSFYSLYYCFFWFISTSVTLWLRCPSALYPSQARAHLCLTYLRSTSSFYLSALLFYLQDFEFSSFYSRDFPKKLTKLDKLNFERIFLHSLSRTKALILPQTQPVPSWSGAGKNRTVITKKPHTKHDYKEWFCGM